MLDSGMSEEEMVNAEFEELYPGKVQRTQIAYDAKALTKLHNNFVKTQSKLETVLDKYQMKMEHHKKLKKRDTVWHIAVQCELLHTHEMLHCTQHIFRGLCAGLLQLKKVTASTGTCAVESTMLHTISRDD